MVTLIEALTTYIESDPTLAAKLAGRVYDSVLPQEPGDDNVVVRIISAVSWPSHGGATALASVRIELTVWSRVNTDAAVLANRLRYLLGGFMGSMSGITFRAFQTFGPRNLTNDQTRYYGSQVDVMANIDMDTVA